MKQKIKISILLILLLAVMTVIFVFSSQPAEQSQKLSNGLLNKLIRYLRILPWFREDAEHRIRKAAHFLEFSCLGFLTRLSFDELFAKDRKRPFRITLFSVIFSFIYACSDEIHQIFVPGRSCELRDILIDSSGALLGIAAAFLLVYLLYRKAGRSENEDTTS